MAHNAPLSALWAMPYPGVPDYPADVAHVPASHTATITSPIAPIPTPGSHSD